jgi:hypothetical protein
MVCWFPSMQSHKLARRLQWRAGTVLEVRCGRAHIPRNAGLGRLHSGQARQSRGRGLVERRCEMASFVPPFTGAWSQAGAGAGASVPCCWGVAGAGSGR